MLASFGILMAAAFLNQRKPVNSNNKTKAGKEETYTDKTPETSSAEKEQKVSHDEHNFSCNKAKLRLTCQSIQVNA